MRSLGALSAAAWLSSRTVLAQTVLEEVIHGAIVYSTNGDRTPVVQSYPVLTPLGAQQLFNAGSVLRNRYILDADGNGGIQGLASYALDSQQVSVLTRSDQYHVASAQAFIQGLYPPASSSVNYTLAGVQGDMANGSSITSPLNGYQYAPLYTASTNDLNSIWVGGQVNCPLYTASSSDYFNTAEYEELQDSTHSFYESLQPDVLEPIFADGAIGYFDAYYIYDYLQYAKTHNASAASLISSEDLQQARILADRWFFAMNGNLSAEGSSKGDQIRAISGRTVTTEILRLISTNVNTNGENNKMSFLFGGNEPMVAFASLAGLATSQYPQFFGQPKQGSSMVFELYSLQPNRTTSYPDVDDLMVRFLFRNGTDEEAELVPYPLFGHGPSRIGLPLNEFTASMEAFMILSVRDWCQTCQSYSVWCPSYVDSDDGISPSTGSSGLRPSTSSRTMSPAVAGVIGAIIALAIAGMIFGVAMLVGGIRLYRLRTKKRSHLNGFKGGEKLASDQDVSVPKSGIGASVVPAGVENPEARPRIGSWELNPGKAKGIGAPHIAPSRRSSLDEDGLRVSPFADPVKAEERV